MTRAKVSTISNAAGAAGDGPTPPRRHAPGLVGPSSIGLPVAGAAAQGELVRLLGVARALRPLLRREQQATEERGHYGPEVHEAFLENGFYRMLQPASLGGLQLDAGGFYQVIAEVGRGCPSTAWCLALSTGHALTLASYWPLTVQQELFAQTGHFICPASGGGSDVEVVPVEGGYRLSGSWRYASGSPWSTHFMPTIMVPGEDGEAVRSWAVVPRNDYTILDDWGRIIGMRGSGSNGIVIDDVFVPADRVVAESWTTRIAAPTAGWLAHGVPTYAGPFMGFAEGEPAAATVGLGYAALDEFERIIRKSKAPYDTTGATRADLADWRRVLGTAMARVDAASAIVQHGARTYEERARRAAEGVEVFDSSQSMRLNNVYFMAEELVWEAVQSLIRAAGTSPQADGQALQRYMRDVWTVQTRTDQLEFFAAPTIGHHFDVEAEWEARQTEPQDARVAEAVAR